MLERILQSEEQNAARVAELGSARVQALGGHGQWTAGDDGGAVFTLWLPLVRNQADAQGAMG